MTELPSSLPEFDEDDQDAAYLLKIFANLQGHLSENSGEPNLCDFLDKYDLRETMIEICESLVQRLKEGTF